MPSISDDPFLDFVVAEAVTHRVAQLREQEQKKQAGAQNRNPKNDPDLSRLLS